MKTIAVAVSLVLATGPVLAGPMSHQLARPDGSLIHYTLDFPDQPAAGLLLIAQGSSCAPGATTPSLHAIRTAFPDHVALIVEKIGVTPDAPISDGTTDCPPDFVERYTLSQRIDDYTRVVAHLADDATIPADRLVLFGGSEGGLAVAKLTGLLRPAATIMLSSATHSTFGEMVRSTVPPEGHDYIDRGFAAVRADPDSSALFAGSTHRFWADAMDYRALDDLMAADIPLLLIQGNLDTASPLLEARATTDAFAEAGKCNLTYWEFPAFDHSMRAPDGTSRLTQVAHLAAAWARQPMSSCP